MAVSVARVSQIEHGEVTSFEVIARYVEALGGRLDLVADFGDRTIRLPVSDGHSVTGDGRSFCAGPAAGSDRVLIGDISLHPVSDGTFVVRPEYFGSRILPAALECPIRWPAVRVR